MRTERALQRRVNTQVREDAPTATHLSSPQKWTPHQPRVHVCDRCGEEFPSLGSWAQHVNPQVGPSPCLVPRPGMPEVK